MTLATLLSRTPQGLEAPLVRVEVDVGSGLPAFSVVGLLETTVKESKDRVRAALANCGYEFPAGRVTVNLAPADLPKEGGRFDLAIAVGILAASELLPSAAFDGVELYGELSLGGDVHGTRGILPSALQAGRAGHAMIVPAANAIEAALARGARVLTATHLRDVCRHATGQQALPLQSCSPWQEAVHVRTPDLADVRGQAGARRALEIAAAGGHSVLFIGPPGSGKSMLAQRLSGLLPPLDDDEALETASIRSLSRRGLQLDQWRRRPFRAPHHTASAISIVGGGARPRPGEISLAHNGVLFLDELPEFRRDVLEVLREPLESGHVAVARAAFHAEFPARFQLVAAMNPCPCGHFGDPQGRCRCPPERIAAYRGRLSGPLLDRIDLHVEVGRVAIEDMESSAVAPEDTATVARRVAIARDVQCSRQARLNARLDAAELATLCRIDLAARELLGRAMRQLGLSARAYHRVLRVARTIADLARSEVVRAEHVAEAVTLRQLDRRSSVHGTSAPST
ncbi:MAG TPA: YifB family Mg chelatase-like AAA ATPase [Steroidobacteraceae bacterium]|nr:YifB family Mg chelatase-like AAA ATPase [Steroidobacteraceae bacterium]